MDWFMGWMSRNGVRIDMVIGTVFLMALAGVVILYIDRIARNLLLKNRARFRLSYEMVLFVARAITVFLCVGAGMLVLNFWGISVTGLWTVFVSVAAVIGVGFLAVWTMVSNITANVFLTIWRPFQMGSTVEILPENLKGRVVDRNMMFTVLREKEGGALYIPNNLFFQKVFRVRGADQKHLFEFFEWQNSNPTQSEAIQAHPSTP